MSKFLEPMTLFWPSEISVGADQVSQAAQKINVTLEEHTYIRLQADVPAGASREVPGSVTRPRGVITS